MGRPCKYKTETERNDAKRSARRAYYHKNILRERESARLRWQSRVNRDGQERLGTAGPPTRLTVQAAARVLGGALSVDTKTNWKLLEPALREDLARWRSGNATSDKDEFAALTTLFISCKRDSQRLDKLRLDVQHRQTFITTIEKLARDADRALFAWNPGKYSTHFLRLAQDAATLEACLDELLMYRREGQEAVQSAFEARRLFWQNM